MDDKHHSAKDVPVATIVGVSTSSTPMTATAVDLYALPLLSLLWPSDEFFTV